MRRRSVQRAFRLATGVWAVLATLAVAAPTGAPEPIAVGALRDWPPQYSSDASGRPIGFAIDMMSAVARDAGFEPRFVVYDDFPAMIAALESGEIRIVPNYGITEDRSERALFTRPIETFPIVLFVRSDSTGIAGLGDLTGRPVAVVRSNVGVDLIRSWPEIVPVRYLDVRSAFYDLLAGRVDGMIFPRPVIVTLARNAGLDDRIRVAGAPLAEIRRAIAVRPEDGALRDRLDAALADIMGSGEYQTIYRRWYAAPRPWWTAQRVAWAAAAVLAGVGVAVLAWRVRANRRLFLEASRRLRAEEALRERDEQLRQVQKMEAIGQLAGGVAHDFNNILSVVLGNVAILSESVRPEDRELLDEIADATRRATALTRQLLVFSRRQLPVPVVLDPAAVVRDLERLLARALGSDVALEIEASARPCLVRVDRSQLEQVLINLALNARDAMPRGGTLRVRVGREVAEAPGVAWPDAAAGPYAVIEFRDTGHGMDAETRARLFEPFFTTKEPGKGTGLGLATVHGIVRQSGGFIRVESAPGAGASFRVALPCVGPHASTPAVAEPSAKIPEPTVLLVEDEFTVRRLLARAIRGAGYRVILADNGESALESAEGAGIHVLVTDVAMPGMGGIELTRRLTAERPGLPVVFISGHSGIDLEGMLDTPERRFLAKPFSPRELVDVLDELVRRG